MILQQQKNKIIKFILTENQVFNFKGDKQIESLNVMRVSGFTLKHKYKAHLPIGTPRFECFTKIKRYENGSDSRKHVL
jgi:hypothetical protein